MFAHLGAPLRFKHSSAYKRTHIHIACRSIQEPPAHWREYRNPCTGACETSISPLLFRWLVCGDAVLLCCRRSSSSSYSSISSSSSIIIISSSSRKPRDARQLDGVATSRWNCQGHFHLTLVSSPSLFPQRLC